MTRKYNLLAPMTVSWEAERYFQIPLRRCKILGRTINKDWLIQGECNITGNNSLVDWWTKGSDTLLLETRYKLLNPTSALRADRGIAGTIAIPEAQIYRERSNLNFTCIWEDLGTYLESIQILSIHLPWISHRMPRNPKRQSGVGIGMSNTRRWIY